LIWAFIIILVLAIPLLSIILDSQLGRALAARIERRSLGAADDLLADRIAFLEGEVERLSSEVRRIDDEGQFVHRLLTDGSPTSSPAESQPASGSERGA
jgi:hypothetical protein